MKKNEASVEATIHFRLSTKGQLNEIKSGRKGKRDWSLKTSLAPEDVELFVPTADGHLRTDVMFDSIPTADELVEAARDDAKKESAADMLQRLWRGEKVGETCESLLRLLKGRLQGH